MEARGVFWGLHQSLGSEAVFWGLHQSLGSEADFVFFA
jgi:hypothetical protein